LRNFTSPGKREFGRVEGGKRKEEEGKEMDEGKYEKGESKVEDEKKGTDRGVCVYLCCLSLLLPCLLVQS